MHIQPDFEVFALTEGEKDAHFLIKTSDDNVIVCANKKEFFDWLGEFYSWIG